VVHLPLRPVGDAPAQGRAESVTETDIAIFKKTETDTDVGIEKTENRREKNENSVFADDDLLISSIFIFCR